VGDGQTQSLRMKADGCWGGIAHDDKHVV
jgi:hypothetical protein